MRDLFIVIKRLVGLINPTQLTNDFKKKSKSLYRKHGAILSPLFLRFTTRILVYRSESIRRSNRAEGEDD